ncbi:MAG: tetratricopeptide repeat protein [Methanoregulaceae archaeon]|nr:tetratricopeptide repeat protein [Methanoregulaceae archaeon]MCU0628340.1 tetratricopeptide repeat protein [Methanoregulaceae archaeon]
MAMWHRRGDALAGAGVLALLLLFMVMAVPAAAAPVTATEWYNEGNNFTNQKRFDMAIHAYDHAIALNPSYARAYFARGQALAMLGLHADALAAYEKAIAIDPDLVPVVASYLETSEKVVYPDIPSGSLIKGYWVSGWRFLEIDNRQGAYDVVVALAPRGTDGATSAVYIKKGFAHYFDGLVPPGSYDMYITYGSRWNSQKKQFDRDAGYLKWELPQYFQGASGYGYSMTFVSKQYQPSWYYYNLEPIAPSDFPKL